MPAYHLFAIKVNYPVNFSMNLLFTQGPAISPMAHTALRACPRAIMSFTGRSKKLNTSTNLANKEIKEPRAEPLSMAPYPKGTPRRCLGQDPECASLVLCSTCRKCQDESCFSQNSSGFFESRACIDCENRKKKERMKRASEGEDASEQASPNQASSSQVSLDQTSQLVRPIHPPTQQQLSSLHASNLHEQGFGHFQPDCGYVYTQESLGLPQSSTGSHQPTSGPYQQVSGPPLAYFSNYG
ncbi:hypothetical protein CSIM01_13598 [Colletotrichum simmondsii]|uniref:Uncharacterized protein n=1 Tax=Colletotrichum simmondsii TaxID=703756 RepID=A0A135RNT5_9PEZI|nr:hypothetical protein CSIM01_13598 [Colletotrichum simmondsii]